MADNLFKPTGNYPASSMHYPDQCYDNDYGDESTAGWAHSVSTRFVIYGCDNNIILEKVNSGKKITKLILHIKSTRYSSNNAGLLMKCVYDISGYNDSQLTDAGDGSIKISTLTDTITEYTVSFPNSITFFNENPTKFNGMGCLFSGVAYKLYDIWWEIEFEDTISNIYIDKTKVKKIYIDKNPAKIVYINNTKVYVSNT